MLPANWESGLLPALLSLFLGLCAGQVFHLVLINFDLPRLFQLSAQIAQKETKHFLLPALKKRIPNLILPGRKVLLRWFLPVQDCEHYAGVAVADRAADVARLHGESHSRRARHGTD